MCHVIILSNKMSNLNSFKLVILTQELELSYLLKCDHILVGIGVLVKVVRKISKLWTENKNRWIFASLSLVGRSVVRKTILEQGVVTRLSVANHLTIHKRQHRPGSLYVNFTRILTWFSSFRLISRVLTCPL